MPGDEDAKRRGETLRPPAPGTTEEIVVPRRRSGASKRPSSRPPKKRPSSEPRAKRPSSRPPTKRPSSQPRAKRPSSEPPRRDLTESWRPPPQEEWPALPEQPRVPEFPDLFLPEETDPHLALPPAPAKRTPSSRPPADPRTEEGRAVYAERAVATIDARDTAIPEALVPNRDQRIREVVIELAQSGPESDGPMRKRLLGFGPDCLPLVARAFPGKIWIDLNRPHRPIQSARHLSGCASVLSAFGDAAVPYVPPLLRAPRPEVRLAACVVAGDLVHADLVRPLAARLQDDLAVVRNAAMLALRAAALLPEARILRSELLHTLQDESKKKEWRRKAAWTIGQLRDAEAVPQLIELLSDSDVSETVRQSLVLLVGRDQGRFVFQWRSWWKKHGSDGRGRWLVDGLDHKDAKVRARAAEELVLLTGEGFDSRNATTTREQAADLAARYERWLDENES